MDLRPKHEALRIDQEMSLAAVHLFGAVRTPYSTHTRRLDGLLEAVLKGSTSRQTPEHHATHGRVDQRFARFAQAVVLFA